MPRRSREPPGRAWQERPAAQPRKVPVKGARPGQEAVTGLLERGSGSGNGATPDPARPARRGAARLGAADSHFLSNSLRPRKQRPAQPPLPRDWRGHAHQRPCSPGEEWRGVARTWLLRSPFSAPPSLASQIACLCRSLV